MNTLAKIGIIIFAGLYIGLALAIAVLAITQYINQFQRKHGLRER